ncbi:MAG: Asp23/Gls24 family envelope stress response protein [Lawsonibacter sp.]
MDTPSPEVGKAVQDAVKNAVESMTGLEIAAVNVNVGGITFPARPRPDYKQENEPGVC